MDTNLIAKNDIIDGKAIINRDFEIVTANEALYKFIGIAQKYSIIDVIHQVDLDDFIDVVNGLRINQEKSMVIRMKNIENSFRWVLVRIRREENSNKHSDEYIIMHISDIIGMKNQNDIFRNTIQNFRHIIAMENELFYTYDYDKNVFTVNSFIDNEIFNRYSSTLKEAHDYFIENDFVPEDSLKEYESLFADIQEGVVSYTRKFNAYKITKNTNDITYIEINGTTIYNEMIPSRAVGRLKILDSSSNKYSDKATIFNNLNVLVSHEDMDKYINYNIEMNQHSELALIKYSIDNLDSIKQSFGEKIFADINNTAITTMKKTFSGRGVFIEYRPNEFYAVIKDCNAELNLRSFLERFRTRISWECHKKYSECTITLSLGIARYPDNNNDWTIIRKKMEFAYKRSLGKGGNSFVIFKEHLHKDLFLEYIKEDSPKTKQS